MDISIDQAKALCAIVDHAGYTAASRILHKSHSSLIYSIQNLEKQCGFNVFDRRKYRNELTPKGQRVYDKCRDLLTKVVELQQLCSQFSDGWEPSIRIVIDGSLPFSPFLDLSKKFRSEKIPTIIQTYTDYLEGVEDSFKHLQADIAISILPLENKNLKPYYLKPLKSYLVAHKEHPIHLKNKKWTINELLDFDFLTIRGSGSVLGLNTNEFEKTASFFLSNFFVKKEAILQKSGFGWLPEHLIEKELQKKILIPIRWERESSHRIQPLLYTKANHQLGPATDLIINALK